MKNTKGLGTLIAIVLVAIVLIGVLGWYIYDTGKRQSPAKPTPEQQANPNDGYVTIKEWGVRFKTPEDWGVLEYFKPSGLEGDVLTFTTKQLSEAASGCSAAAGNVISGLLTRGKELNPENGEVITKIGEYYYQYRVPQVICGDMSGLSDKGLEIPDVSEALKRLEPAE